MKRAIFEVAPFTDTGRPAEAREICEHWPVQPTLGYPYAQDIGGLPETLIASVTRDPATPHEGGTLLTAEGEQQGVALTGDKTCVKDTVADHPIRLKLPSDGMRCAL